MNRLKAFQIMEGMRILLIFSLITGISIENVNKKVIDLLSQRIGIGSNNRLEDPVVDHIVKEKDGQGSIFGDLFTRAGLVNINAPILFPYDMSLKEIAALLLHKIRD